MERSAQVLLALRHELDRVYPRPEDKEKFLPHTCRRELAKQTFEPQDIHRNNHIDLPRN